MSAYHTAVIGAGSGGITVAVGLSKLGKSVALIEKKQVGGDCTNVGCIPSKTLIHASNDPHLTPRQVLARVRDRRDHLRDEETQWLSELNGVRLKFGEARFLDSHTLELDGAERISARNFVIATGSRPRELPLGRVLTNETLFDLEEPPRHLAIVGGGVIGCELAFAFRRLGSRVTLLDFLDRLMSVSEPEVSELLSRRFKAIGVELRLGVGAESFQGGSLKLSDGSSVDEVDEVLLAAGRVPNLDLDLERAGVEFNKHGIPTNHFGRTNVSHIYAIGDVNLNSAFTHSANHQGRRLVQKLCFPLLPLGAEPHYPAATFSDPEVAQVGPPLARLQQKYHPKLIRSCKVDLKDTDRGYTSDIQEGFVLIHALKLTGKVLSATIVAPCAGEMIPVLTHAVNGGATMFSLAGLVFPYPTLAEAIKKAASNYVFETLPQLHKDSLAHLFYGWRTQK